MAVEMWIDGTAGSDGNDGLSSGAPKKTFNGCATSAGVLPADVTINIAAGSAPVTCNTNALSSNKGVAFRGPTDGHITLRAYGGGAKPQLNVGRCGIKTLGNGNLSVSDVDLFQDLTGGYYGTATALESRTGGGMNLSNVEIRGFFTSVKCGTGTVLLYRVTARGPLNSGLLVDADPFAPVGQSGIIRECVCYSNDPLTQNDLMVLHDGGYGIRSGWIVEDNRVETTEGAGSESGLDIQQQFRGVIVRRNQIIRPTQWGFTQGSLFQSGVTTVFATKAAMLANFSREGTTASGKGVGTGSQIINGGHCAWVTADGGNNGLWQLTGSDPQNAAAWTGPMTADDMLTNPSLYYQNTLVGSGSGMHLRHPGTQFCGNTLIDVNLGNYATSLGTYGGGNLLHVYDMGYGCKVYGNVYQTTSGKYVDAQTGALVASTRSFITVDALNAQIAQRERVKLRNNVFRIRAEHTGPFIEFKSANDHSYVDSDYNAWIHDAGVSDTDKANFSLTVATARTYSAYKTVNGGSDAHSLWQTPTTAVIDGDSRPSDGSTLIGAGVAWSGLDAGMPLADVAGNALSSPPEIGAYIYVSEAALDAVRGTPRRVLRAQRIPGGPPGGVLPPDAVAGLANVGGASTATTLLYTWDAGAAATYYELRYSLTGLGVWTTFGSTFGATSGTITGLAGATTYDVQVRAVNGAGAGPWSASVQGTTA